VGESEWLLVARTAYELARLEAIRRNQAELVRLGMAEATEDFTSLLQARGSSRAKAKLCSRGILREGASACGGASRPAHQPVFFAAEGRWGAFAEEGANSVPTVPGESHPSTVHRYPCDSCWRAGLL